MKFKVDENLPLEVVDELRHAGYDALNVYEQKLGGIYDSELAKVCQNEQRIIVTLDTDFADIRSYPPEEFSGIIVLRLRSQDKAYILDTISKVVRMFPNEPIKHKLWIVDDSYVRIRS